MAQLLKGKGHNVVPGQKICRTCIKQYKMITQSTEMYVTALETEDDLDFAICEIPRTKVNLSLETTGASPIYLHAIPQHARLSAAKMKLSKGVDKLRTYIFGAYQIDDELTNICLFDISEEQMTLVRKSLVERFNLGRTVPGILSSHQFVPTSTSTINKYLTVKIQRLLQCSVSTAPPKQALPTQLLHHTSHAYTTRIGRLDW
ncbi:unnamed protein product [Lepeophtheirus salmonis]|uniref:(salmon louse) hypothetical protein n=1 Tax=Lepeophtheirus salmonis TaxID=72036 RepID=A0A7R8H710_LEPSM|nr:unnamed protein product [Lepeophtheirus salmonis]CAF2899322.1 unnamed protein product [Lepeophtheirus salmonis]